MPKKLPTFYYKVKGSNDESANVGITTADDQDAALVKLNTVYGNTPDNEIAAIEFIDESEFERIQGEKGKDLAHRPE